MSLLRSNRRKADAALAAALETERGGDPLGAIAELRDANQRKRSPLLERELVRLRSRAFDRLESEASTGTPPPVEPADDPLPHEEALPCVDADQLSASVVRQALLESGSLIVRGLLDPDRAASLRGGIDKVFDGRESWDEADPHAAAPWFDPFKPEPRYETAVGYGRSFVNEGSGIWLADSPRLLFELTEIYEEIGVSRMITDYLGERPAMSVNKGTLRRAAPTAGTEWWHQDGAFLGDQIRSLNVWLALSDCGVDAPGMDVVSKRVDQIVETGTEGADFDWSVGEPVVERIAGDSITRPRFAAGDAMIFDHLCLHRTGTDPSMTETRYATETWFFAPSAYPDPMTQVPLAL